MTLRSASFVFSAAAAAALAPIIHTRPDTYREGVSPLSLVTLNSSFADAYGAKCLDGTPPAYWVLPQDPTKWVVFVEGGGWCYSLSDCVGRAQGYLGTSNGMGAQNYPGGIVDANSTNNPAFSTWSLVFVHYCDGSSHTSNTTAPTPVPADIAAVHGTTLTQIWNRGRNNLVAVLQHLLQVQGMHAATDVILSGGSAGALTVYLGIDALVPVFPPTTKLYGFPDAGYFLDGMTYSGNATAYRNNIIGGNSVWGSTNASTLPPACLAAYPGEEWHCLMTPYVAPFIATPTFVMNAAYDMWQITNVLQLSCFVPRTCDAAAMAAFQAYRTAQIAAVSQMVAARPYTGVYIDSCFVHEQNVDYCSGQSLPNCRGWNLYNVTAPGYPSQITPDAAFALWYNAVSAAYPQRPELNSRAAVERGDVVAPAAVQIVDPVEYPNNPSCPWPTPAPQPKLRASKA